MRSSNLFSTLFYKSKIFRLKFIFNPTDMGIHFQQQTPFQKNSRLFLPRSSLSQGK